MENITITTPNEFVAHIKPKLTYGEYLQVKRIFSSSLKIDPQAGTARDTEASILDDVERKATEILLIKIVDKEGKEYPPSKLYELDIEDGEAITNIIRDIREKAEPTAKKNEVK